MKKFEAKKCQVAVYWDGDTKFPCYIVFEGIPYGKEYVRVSNFVDVYFEPLPAEELVANRLEALSHREQEVLAEFHKAMEEIKSDRQRLLALTHQPEENAHDQETHIRGNTTLEDDFPY